MSHLAFLAGFLVLASLTCPALSQAPQMTPECNEGITTCTSTMMAAAATGNEPCSGVGTFQQCVVNIPNCEIDETVAQIITQQAVQAMATYGYDCGSVSAGGPSAGGPGAGGPGAGGPGAGGPAGLPAECTQDMGVCQQSYQASISNAEKIAAGMCSILDEFTACLNAARCPLTAAQKQQILDEMNSSMREGGVICDSSAVAGAGSDGTGASSGQMINANAAGKFQAVVILFKKHNCGDVPEKCLAQAGDQTPSCKEMKKAFNCLYDKCEAIVGTGDDKEAANYLVDFASGMSQCKFTSEEIMPSGGAGVFQRPVWGSLTVILVAAVVKKLLV